MGATPVCQITAAGLSRPTFADCLTYVQSAFRAIYGQDVYLGADCQDGQLTALLAQAIHDANGEAEAVYQSFSPATAVGAGLDIIVKINGIRRKSPTFSTCDFLAVGQVGVTVTNGVLRDPNGNAWTLPTFTFPASGQLTVTATCQTKGAVALAAGGLDTAAGKGTIATPMPGFQQVTNPTPAIPGQPVETDAALRQRQSISTQLPSQSLFEGLIGAIAAIGGVTRLRGYENDTGYPDANGLPGHAICVVVDGGDVDTIAALIARKKGSAGTYGRQRVAVTDAAGVTRQVAFSRSTEVPIAYALTVRSLGAYTQGVDALLKQAVADWTNGLGIGVDVDRDAAYLPAKLGGAAAGRGYEITRLAIGRNGAAPTEASVAIAYDERATCDAASVVVTVTR